MPLSPLSMSSFQSQAVISEDGLQALRQLCYRSIPSFFFLKLVTTHSGKVSFLAFKRILICGDCQNKLFASLALTGKFGWISNITRNSQALKKFDRCSALAQGLTSANPIVCPFFKKRESSCGSN